jgi:hypothetical protein
MELWDPEMSADEAFLRFGTDRAGMVSPAPIITNADGYPVGWEGDGLTVPAEDGAVADARATREHMARWAQGGDTHRGES